jgi:regulator of RNase E activity RraA
MTSGEPNIGFRVRMHIARPSADQVEHFEGWPTGNVCDANGRLGAMDYRIKPLVRSWRFVGPAVTVRARPVDNLVLYKALDVAQKGDVLVVTNDASSFTSILGDRVCSIAKAKGLSAIVTDGMVRDGAGIREVGLPVFCRGLTPNSPYKDGPGEINFPIACGGLPIYPGDIIIGDEDGVVVVHREDIPAVLKMLEKIGEKELKMAENIEAGKLSPGWVDEVLKEKGCQILE